MKCIFRQILRSNVSVIIVLSIFTASLFAVAIVEKKIEPVVITSERMCCKKNNNNELIVTYNDNVRVELPNKGTVSAESLEIVLNTASFSKKEMSINDCKSVQLFGNVEVRHENNRARADCVDLFLGAHECYLKGQVQLEQSATKERPIPLKTECQQAKIDLSTWDIALEGNSQMPVKTTLVWNVDQQKHNESTKKAQNSNTKVRSSKVVHAKNKSPSA